MFAKALCFSLYLPLVAVLAASGGPATFFHITNFRASANATNQGYPSITFTISNPNAVFEQGGNTPHDCKISWDTFYPPSCWTECGDGQTYYVRVKAYEGVGSVSLDVAEYYVYKNSALNEATFSVRAGSASYSCSEDAECTTCAFGEGDFRDVPFTSTYGVSRPDVVC